MSEEGQDEKDYYKDNISFYIKAVIEEYAEMPYIEREFIYHRELVDEIELAKSEQKVLKIMLKNERDGKNNIKYVKVLGIYRDKEYLYNYVAGLMCDNRKGDWKPGAVRLTSVNDCDRLEQSAFISKENRDLVAEIIKRQGVQYLPAGDCDYRVVVEFTPKGEKMYQKMLHLRPLYVKRASERIYEFICPKLQAQSYFFRFGQEAKILEPPDLAEEFLKRYQSAAKKISNIDNLNVRIENRMDGRYNNERGNLQKKPKISLKTNIVRIFWQLRAKMTLETLDFSGFGRDAVEMREARLGH